MQAVDRTMRCWPARRGWSSRADSIATRTDGLVAGCRRARVFGAMARRAGTRATVVNSTGCWPIHWQPERRSMRCWCGGQAIGASTRELLTDLGPCAPRWTPACQRWSRWSADQPQVAVPPRCGDPAAAMRRRLRAALVAFGLAACGNNPPVPDWQMNARGALEAPRALSVRRQPDPEDVSSRPHRRLPHRSGRPAARLELARCATRVASTVLEVCAGFEALRADAGPPERTYAAYLAGQAGRRPGWRCCRCSIARSPHHPMPSHRLQEVADPLARLVAAGVLTCKPGAPTRTDHRAGFRTASAQGWRRPLLAWLGVQATQRAAAAGRRCRGRTSVRPHGAGDGLR